MNASSFRARGVIDTEGLTTSYRFDYITTAAYEANVGTGRPGFSGAERLPVVDAKVLGSALDQEVLQRIGGLSAETSYRFRLVAKSSGGESEGPARTIATQEATPAFALAENRRWELVSPIDKNGGGVAPPGELFGGGDLQAAAQGGSITYGSASSFAAAAGAPGASQYVSTRTPFGWSTVNVTLPTSAGVFGAQPDGTPYRLFGEDLTAALALSAPHAFQSLAMDPVPRATGSLAAPDLRLAGSTDDLRRLVFATCQALTPDALEVPGGGGCDPAFPNLYLKGASGLRLVNLQPGSPVGDPGAALAAPAGAISSSGDRVYWVDAAGNLLVRDGGRSLLVAPGAVFEAASADGTIAYYTKEAHLYRYSLDGESTTDLTPGGGVEGVFGASASGAYVYYLDGGGVELWRQGATTAVAAAADPANFPAATGAARVTADGTRLVFLSSAPLLGYDPEGASQVYRYDATSGSLSCASCNPYGARPSGPSSIPGAIANGSEATAYKPRVMDVDGSRVFFDSGDALVPADTNGQQDVYEWRAPGVAGCARAQGCVGLISSGTGADDAEFIDASADGSDAFFLTSASLLPVDPGAMDIYDARIGGGFPEPEPSIPCFGDDCQPLPAAPDDPTPGTQFHGSEGNPELQVRRAGKKPKGKKHQHGKRKHKRGSKRGHHQGTRR